jgi:hypothetical protein
VGFVFHDYSGNGFDVACTAVTGKGFSQNAKFMEIEGRSGNAIRIDMKRKPNPDPAPGYPWDHLFFLLSANVSTPSGLAVREIPDPYDSHRMLRILTDPADPQRFCRPMERKRYAKLLQDLLDGTGIAVSATLNIDEAMKIVMVLDRIWRAVQAFPREIYSPLGSLDPLRF